MFELDREGLADIAYKTAVRFYGGNRDRSLEMQDFVQEILMALSKEYGRGRRDRAWLWTVARNKAIDLLRRGRYRAAVSYDEALEQVWSGDGTGQTEARDDLLDRIEAQQEAAVLPEDIRNIGDKRVDGQPLSGGERMRLSRFRRSALRDDGAVR